MKKILVFFAWLFCRPSFAFAWTPLVSSADFAGMLGDMSTIAAGIVTLALVLVGITFIVRAMSN